MDVCSRYEGRRCYDTNLNDKMYFLSEIQLRNTEVLTFRPQEVRSVIAAEYCASAYRRMLPLSSALCMQ